MEMLCVYCETGTEYLNITEIKFLLLVYYVFDISKGKHTC
jgi:hypothetical protein